MVAVSPSGNQMEFDYQKLQQFLAPQLRDFGGQHEVDHGLWTVFAVAAADTEANAIARSLLSAATFAHDSGVSADDQWTLYYVDTANRPLAIAWLEDLAKVLAGEIRPVTAAQRVLIEDFVKSARPHRVAQELADLHARGEVCAGIIRKTAEVRSLLDRLHQCEPLFFSAFLTLLNHHLVDMVVLHRQLLPEDIELKNEMVLGELSRDPFLQSRQDAASEIRNILLRFQLINPIDQHKNVAISNPYAVFLDVIVSGEEVLVPIDGNAVPVPRAHFLNAIHAIRRNLYRGEKFSSFDTQSPWMNGTIAYSFRFIKQGIESRADLSVMDLLYMFERAAGE